MNIPDPAHNPVLLGHDTALQEIKAAYTSGRMHHAWLITGQEGIGKTTLAYHMVHHALSGGQNPLGSLDMQHPAARLVTGGAHPDFFILRRPVDEKTGEPKDSIAVEEARKLVPFLRRTATHGGWRVALIDEAHALNRFGQNAILKVIEEPPQKCLILLTATTAGALLPTIRSRCRVLALQPLGETILRDLLARFDGAVPGDEEGAQLIRLASGSIGFALKVLQTESLPLYKDLLGLLQDLPALDIARAHALADRINRKADIDSFRVITRLLNDLLRRTARALALGETDRPEVAQMAGKLARVDPRGERSLRLWEKVGQTLAAADHANLDRKLAFVNSLTEIHRNLHATA